MPNWCENELKVTGHKESIDALLNLIKSDDLSFDFERVIPHPEGIKHNSERATFFESIIGEPSGDWRKRV